MVDAGGRRRFRLGVMVNPVAGMGGRLALHGTDGPAAVRAIELGGAPTAHLRMRRALAELRTRLRSDIEVMAASGSMGADLLAEIRWQVIESFPVTAPSSAEDTRDVVRAMAQREADLILFAGGDGTAADIIDAIGTDTTVLGVPSGVKMHSGVFAVSPEAAGAAVAAFVDRAEIRATTEAEIVDEVLVDPGQPRPQLLAMARVPKDGRALQGAKTRTSGPVSAEVRALGRSIAEQMAPGRTYVLGPGLTVATISEHLGLAGSRRGFDLVVDGRQVARDVTEAQLFDHLSGGRPTTLVLGVIGGQGFLLGRGNQQLSPRVLELLGEDVLIVAARDKIETLDPMELRVDLGEESPNRMFDGYRRVHTAPRRSMIVRIAS